MSARPLIEYGIGLLCKIRPDGISGSLLSWINSYHSYKRQRVVLPDTGSSWYNIYAGVPQGSILSTFLFLLYINDIVKDIESNIRRFADDMITQVYIYLLKILCQPHELLIPILKK